MREALRRVAIVFAGAVLGWIVVRQAGDALFDPGYHRLRHVLNALAVSGLVVPLVLLADRFLDRRPWSTVRAPAPGRHLLTGAAAYLVPAGLALAVFVGAGLVEVDLRGPVLRAVTDAATLLLLVLLYEALPEELLFRGYLFRNLDAVLPRWGVVLAQAVLFTTFGVVIGAAGSVERVLLFFAFAVVQGLIRSASGSVWAPVGFHLAFQTAEQLVGDAWHRFTVDDLALLQQVTLGLVPLSLGALTVHLILAAVPGIAKVRSATAR